MAKKIVLAGRCRTAIGSMGWSSFYNSGTGIRIYRYQRSFKIEQVLLRNRLIMYIWVV